MEQVSTATNMFSLLDEKKQEKVYCAAVDEFSLKGYSNASVNNIVQSAGISKGSLFTYFKTKSSLFDGLASLAVDKVKDYLRPVRDETTEINIIQRLETFLRSGFSFIDKHPRLTRIYFNLLYSGDTPFRGKRLQRIHAESREFLSELLQESLQKGELNPELDVNRTAFLLNAMFEQLLRAYYIEYMAQGLGLHKGKEEDLKQWIEATMGFIKNGIMKV
tara:strand:- start:24673 stop:25329 length:657 start_codon:yes stop_codon:yes gene_type:complete